MRHAGASLRPAHGPRSRGSSSGPGVAPPGRDLELPTAELPWYRIVWDQAQARHGEGVLSTYEVTATEILERIRHEGPLSSIDFERKPAIDWWWGPTSETRAVLEAL